MVAGTGPQVHLSGMVVRRFCVVKDGPFVQ